MARLVVEVIPSILRRRSFWRSLTLGMLVTTVLGRVKSGSSYVLSSKQSFSL